MTYKVDKSTLVDDRGRALTQSLFLEVGYTKFAVYTLKDDDHKYKGKVYPSLKRLYLEHEDPTEYDFVQRYLLNWKQWKQMLANKQLAAEIAEWREELELKLRAQAVRDMIDQSVDKGSFQASKWLADRGWESRGAGRPKKEDKLKEERLAAKIQDEYSADVLRMVRKN